MPVQSHLKHPQEQPPIARQVPAEITAHGRKRIDPYAWLKDPNWQQVMHTPSVLDADIRAYLEAENAYTAAVMAPTEALQDKLFREIRGRIKEDDSSVPAPDGPFAYYQRFDTGGEHPVFCRHARDGGPEEVVYDANKESAGHAYFRVAAVHHSPDHARIAYTLDLNGSEYFALHVRDIASGAVLPDRIENVQGEMVWGPDSATLYYTVLDEHHRPCRVMRHRLGDDPSADKVIYEERDPGFFVGIGMTESRRFIVVDAHDHTTSEVRVIDTAAADQTPRLIAPRRRDVLYEVSHHGDRFLILTNADGAEDFKVVEAPIEAPDPANWRDMVPYEPGRLIRHLQVFADRTARLEMVDALPRIVVTDLAGGGEHAIAFDEEAFSLGVQPGFEYATDTLRFAYSSPTTPYRIYDYDMATRERVLRKEQEIPSGHDPAAYVTRRLSAVSHDGERVPVTVLHAVGTPIDGSAPLLLYGYGSYGHALPAAFSPTPLSLVDRGFVYAVAHVRGGVERGYRWYLDGKGPKKTNTFLDFIAAAEQLIAENYTAAGRIAAHGGSAGGLLVGAVANMRPDLFKAIVGEVPFVDVLTTMSDDTLPLTPPEWPEWGNPIEDPAAYDTIAAYAPYENVVAQPYPHILATGGLTDPRVTYWEPAKWVAKLRAAKTNDALIVLRINMDAGHGGAAGRFERLKEVALMYAFLLLVFDMAEAG